MGFPKKWSSLLVIPLLTVLVLSVPIQTIMAAGSPIQVIIDGEEVEFSVKPVNVNGSVLVPMRAIFEYFQAQVVWEPETRTVRADKEGIRLSLTIGAQEALINGKVVPLTRSAMLIDGSTMVPLRFISEAFQYTVNWDGSIPAVLIQTGSNETNAATLRGVAISPYGFPQTFEHLAEFYREMGEVFEGAVMFNGAWRDDVVHGSDAGEFPEAAEGVVKFADMFGFEPVVVFSWRSGTQLYLNLPGKPVNNWSNSASGKAFMEMITAFAGKYQPPYLFLGNENDFYHEQDSEDYARWIEVYNQTYDAIKSVSPATRVGPVFSYEHIAGQGRWNGWTKEHWEAWKAHDPGKVDLVGISLYPWLKHERPEDIPADYLEPLFQQIGSIPVAITETGWPASASDLLPHEASPQHQLAYIEKLSAWVKENEIDLVNWLYLHPIYSLEGLPSEWQYFADISLYDHAGEKRPAYEAWLRFPE